MATDYAMQDEHKEQCYEVIIAALKDYVQGEDYRKLSQYEPNLAQELVKTDLNFKIGAAPLFQIMKLEGIAWGERYHYSSYDHSRITDAHVKKPFITEPIVFLKNSDEISEETLGKALNVFDIKRSVIERMTEATLRRIAKKAGEETLREEVMGWRDVYSSFERCSDLSFESVQEEEYLHVNPVSIEFLCGTQKQTVVIGYLVAKDTLHFDIVQMGIRAEQAFQRMQKRKKNKKIALITLSCLVPILAIAGYLGYYAFFGGGLSAMPIYQWFSSLFG